jgi:DNA-binding NtrC family response regulator
MKEFSLLVVDDDSLVIQSVEAALPENWRLIKCPNTQSPPESGYQAALVDMHLTANQDEAEGVQVIKKLSSRNPHLEIVAMSGHLDRNIMELCLKAGASRFLAKPLSFDELVLTLQKIEAFFLLQNASRRGSQGRSIWIGTGPSSQRIQKEIASLRNEAGPILIEGESGTGKEVSAQLIHEQDAPSRPMVSINVAGIPEHLFESEFFGHVRGAFTGAEQNKMGLAEAAHGGDLFLDEIEALSIAHQAKLLRFLETGEVRRVGAKDSTFVQCRIIAASNRNLKDMVKEGKFRDDLLWRLRGKTINLPPLRERLEDLPDLTRHFLSLDRARRKSLADDALAVMREYHWPGNIRELKRVCEQLILTSPLPFIRSDDVQRAIQPKTETAAGPTTVDWSRGLPQLVNDYEATLIKKALEAHRQIDDVAKILQISRSSLYKKIKDHSIDWKGE